MRLIRSLPVLALPLLVVGCGPSAEEAAPRFSFSQGPLVTSAERPVPITGGTLLVSRDGRTAIAADPERDTISLVDLTSGSLSATLALEDADEPGRIAEDFNGHAHVALRRGGAVVDIDLASRRIVARHPVCAAPRGIAYDGYRDVLHVACAGGELVSLDRASGATVRSLQIEGGDLRDVIVPGEGVINRLAEVGARESDLASSLMVTRFRNAEMLVVSENGTVSAQAPPVDFCNSSDDADVAWRTVALGVTGQVAMLHQRARASDAQPVAIEPGGYGGGSGNFCEGQGIVKPAMSIFDLASPIGSNALNNSVLAVDIASSHDGQAVAIAIPGNVASPFPQVVVGSPFGRLDPAFGFANANSASGSGGGDVPLGRPTLPFPVEPGSSSTGSVNGEGFVTQGQAIAISFIDSGHIAVQTREPSQIEVFNLGNHGDVQRIRLANDSHADSGQYLFHAGAGQMVACASCHPEGGDDGHVWNFASLGQRRTQSIAGGILGTEPFHWDGDMGDFGDLVTHVFSERMGAGEIGDDHKNALAHYIDRMDIVPPSLPADLTQVERGQELFESERTQCSTCHNGPMLTNNSTVDVGTGGSFQVPTLVGVGHRAPLIHNGCASDLRDRFFNGCAGGDRHGHTSDLTSAEVDDLVAFLKTL